MTPLELKHPTMSPDRLRRAQAKLGLTLAQMAVMLGYEGGNLRSMGHDLLTGRRPIREPQRRLVEAYLEGYRPKDWPLDIEDGEE